MTTTTTTKTAVITGANTGLGLERKVVAAVVVGGAAITGGRGTFTGTVLGVVLLGAIGPALTFGYVAAMHIAQNRLAEAPHGNVGVSNALASG